MPAQKLPLEDPPLNDAVNHQLQQQLQQQQNEDVVDGDDNEQQQQQEQQDEDDEDEDEDDDEEEDEAEEEEEDGGELDDDKSQSSSSDDDGDDVDDDNDEDNDDEDDDNVNKEEFILVRLSDIRKEVQCPICLGIIRKTRTVMECLHRFCRECIDKSMRMGNNECPACRTHCASRRSLRDDPNYDAIISAIYPDIDQYEEEELAFQEDERVRNKQIQAAIAQTFRRQTEALSRKRRRSGNSRKRRNYRSEEDDEANGHDGGKDSSSADERCTEPKPKRPKRWRGQPSPAGASGDGGGDENDQEVQREVGVAPAALIGSTEMLAWGKGGIRSNTRYGSGSGGNGKTSRSRLAKLHEHLRNLDDNEMDIQVVLVSLDQKEPLLEHSYLCGRPALSVGQLCQFIALQTSLPPEKLEILAVRSTCSKASSSPTMQVQTSTSTAFDSSKDELQVLDSKETLAGLKAACNFARGHLLLAYRQKL